MGSNEVVLTNGILVWADSSGVNNNVEQFDQPRHIT